MRFNQVMAKSTATLVSRHNSKEAEARRQSVHDKDEKATQKLFTRIALAYSVAKRNENKVFLTLPYRGGELQFIIRPNRKGEAVLWCLGIGYTSIGYTSIGYTSKPLVLGFIGQKMSAQLGDVRTWRQRVKKDMGALRHVRS